MKKKNATIQRIRHSIRRAIKSGAPGLAEDVLTVQASKALTEHYDPAHLLPYVDFEDGFVLRDDGIHPQMGFGYQIAPAIIGGTDMEDQLETLVSRAPDDTVIQTAMHSSPSINYRVDVWRNERLRHCEVPLLREMVNRRVDHFKRCSMAESLLPEERLHPRELRCYIFVTMTYHEDQEHDQEIKKWVHLVKEYRNSVKGALEAMGLSPVKVGYRQAQGLLRELCNPQINPDELQELAPVKESGVSFKKDCFERQTRLRVNSDGNLKFSDNKNSRTVVAITVDQYPDELKLYTTGQLIGNISSSVDRIAPPFWLYTCIHKPNPDKASDAMTVRQGLLSKQCMSDSEWYRSMVPHIFERRNATQEYVQAVRNKYSPVRMWTGINLVTTEDRASADADYLSGLWRKAGFRASKESYISLPVWQQSLPWGYNPRIDVPSQGMQRAHAVTSLNAATAFICQGDWAGNRPTLEKDDSGNLYPYAIGMLLTSRRGQMACLDLYKSETNYNFAIIATSGAGKSFFANELVADIRCRNGMVRIIDAGGSYRDLVRMIGGTEIRFDPSKPMSLNPYWGIKSTKRFSDDEGSEIGEMMPLLKDVTCQMAFPVKEPTNFEYQSVEKAIYDTHNRVGEEMGLADIREWFVEHQDEFPVYKEISRQLEPYAIDRLAPWFNGRSELDLSNPVTVLELEELNNDPDLRTVVLTLLMAQTTRDMYLSSREIPKMMLTDETWDLFSDPRPAKVIETSFRRVRKYNGSAGFVTQSFEDVNISPAATAAYSNSAWRFALKQAPDSLSYAREHKMLGESEFIYDMVGTAKRGPGFSEVYVMNESGSGLFRFVTDSFTYQVYSSKADDITRLERIQNDRGVDLVEAIRLVSDGEANTDAA